MPGLATGEGGSVGMDDASACGGGSGTTAASVSGSAGCWVEASAFVSLDRASADATAGSMSVEGSLIGGGGWWAASGPVGGAGSAVPGGGNTGGSPAAGGVGWGSLAILVGGPLGGGGDEAGGLAAGIGGADWGGA